MRDRRVPVEFERVAGGSDCCLHTACLEGKLWRSGKPAANIADNRRSSWIKIKNPEYSQMEGRSELFESQ